MIAKLLGLLGLLFLGLIVATAVFFAYAFYSVPEMTVSSKAYVDECLPVILGTWSKDELMQRSSLKMRNQVSEDQIDQIFNTMPAQLGSLLKYNGAQGAAAATLTVENGLATTAFYVGHATFQNGMAEIKIELIRHDDTWQILYFHPDATLTVHPTVP